MVLSLADAVAIFNKWKDDSAEVLVVTESPFQQSRRGVLEQSIDWALGLQGRVAEVSIEPNMKGKKAGTVVLEAPAGNLSLSIGLCTFVYEEPQEAKPVVRAEAASTTGYPTAGTVSYSGSGLRFVGTAHQRVSSVDVVRCRLAQWCAASSTRHRHRASCRN
jgi:hypothetical protein